jgi:hypothetical protein
MTSFPFLSTDQQSTAIALASALVVGVVYLFVLYFLACRGGYKLAVDSPQQRLFYFVWIGLGHFLLAAVPVYLLVEYSFVLPGGVFVMIAGYAVTVELAGSADSSLSIYDLFWLIPMVIVLVAVGIEYVIWSTVLT